MTKRYGIDLGTTYSTISWYDDSRKEVKPLPLESEDGETTSLRSVVYYAQDADPVVGEVAWNTRKQEPERVIVGIKRKMGEDYLTDEIDGVRRSPQEVSAEILQALKDNAETEMGEAVDDVVITVPAYFGERQCAATMEAAKKVGLNVLNILSEPHAAAVAYSIEQATALTDKHVLVYDLGGGTFDVTLIKPVIPADFASHNTEVQNLTLNTMCKDGNRELGGLDWDEVLIDLVAEKCIEQFDVDPRLDPKNAAVLHDNCEKAKRALSKKPSESVVADLQGHMIDVTREEFEERSSGLLLQTQMRLEQVLSEAEETHGITRDMIDVLVAGGATRMPMVKRMITEVMGKAPLEYRNPQLLVACGAGYVAHAIDPTATIPISTDREASEDAPQFRISEDCITDITCQAVGIQVIRKDQSGEARPYNAVVLERGTFYGDQRDFVTETLFDNQAEVCIRLFEGESPDPEECKHLMDFRIEGLPPNRPRGRPIRTTLWFGLNGIISGKAIDLETNTEIDIHYDRWSTGDSAPTPPKPKATPAPAPAPVAADPTPAPAPTPAPEPVAADPTPAPAPTPAPEPVAADPTPAPAPTPAPEPVAADPTPVTSEPTSTESPAAGPFDPNDASNGTETFGTDETTGTPTGDDSTESTTTTPPTTAEQPVSQDDGTPTDAEPVTAPSDAADTPSDDSSDSPEEMPRPLKLY